jgi:hypothetical protein
MPTLAYLSFICFGHMWGAEFLSMAHNPYDHLELRSSIPIFGNEWPRSRLKTTHCQNRDKDFKSLIFDFDNTLPKQIEGMNHSSSSLIFYWFSRRHCVKHHTKQDCNVFENEFDEIANPSCVLVRHIDT